MLYFFIILIHKYIKNRLIFKTFCCIINENVFKCLKYTFAKGLTLRKKKSSGGLNISPPDDMWYSKSFLTRPDLHSMHRYIAVIEVIRLNFRRKFF